MWHGCDSEKGRDIKAKFTKYQRVLSRVSYQGVLSRDLGIIGRPELVSPYYLVSDLRPSHPRITTSFIGFNGCNS